MRPSNTRTLTFEYQRVWGRLEAAKSRVEATRNAAREYQEQIEFVATYERQLESIAYTVRILDPNWTEPSKPIRAKAEPVGNAPRGKMVREALKVLGAATVPMSAKEIAVAIGPTLIASRALTPDEIAQVSSSVSISLSSRRDGFITITTDKPRKFSLASR